MTSQDKYLLQQKKFYVIKRRNKKEWCTHTKNTIKRNQFSFHYFKNHFNITSQHENLFEREMEKEKKMEKRSNKNK